jgi:hypothetical protein
LKNTHVVEAPTLTLAIRNTRNFLNMHVLWALLWAHRIQISKGYMASKFVFHKSILDDYHSYQSLSITALVYDLLFCRWVNSASLGWLVQTCWFWADLGKEVTILTCLSTYFTTLACLRLLCRKVLRSTSAVFKQNHWNTSL